MLWGVAVIAAVDAGVRFKGGDDDEGDLRADLSCLSVFSVLRDEEDVDNDDTCGDAVDLLSSNETSPPFPRCFSLDGRLEICGGVESKNKIYLAIFTNDTRTVLTRGYCGRSISRRRFGAGDGYFLFRRWAATSLFAFQKAFLKSMAIKRFPSFCSDGVIAVNVELNGLYQEAIGWVNFCLCAHYNK